jgi:hypothetical protein
MCKGKVPDKQPVREAKVNEDNVMFFSKLEDGG